MTAFVRVNADGVALLSLKARRDLRRNLAWRHGAEVTGSIGRVGQSLGDEPQVDRLLQDRVLECEVIRRCRGRIEIAKFCRAKKQALGHHGHALAVATSHAFIRLLHPFARCGIKRARTGRRRGRAHCAASEQCHHLCGAQFTNRAPVLKAEAINTRIESVLRAHRWVLSSAVGQRVGGGRGRAGACATCGD